MTPADAGTLLVGVAALGTLLANTLRGRRHGRVLDEINGAVNNVTPGSPPLWQRIDTQTEFLGRLDGKLDAHAAQDERNFREVRDALAEVRGRQTS